LFGIAEEDEVDVFGGACAATDAQLHGDAALQQEERI
jgi:hypothetical protein